MSDYTTIVNARNRTLAADPSCEQRALYKFFQNALDNFDSSDAAELVRQAVQIAAWYIDQPPSGEG